MFKFFKSLNAATKITMVRIALLPLIMFFYITAVMGLPFFNLWGRLIALILFVIAVATDWLDGYIARKYKMVTPIGNMLDTVADKLLMMLGFLLIISDYVFMFEAALPYWFAVIVAFVAIGRDFIITMLKGIAQQHGVTIMADKLGKIKFTIQFVAITLYMFYAFNLVHLLIPDGTIWFNIFTYTCIFLMSAATILSVWSCVNYMVNYAQQIAAKVKNNTKENTEDGTDKK